ncbi:hypothetical protein [Listeria cossartiae]|nr:hypothetical protein [Listeria cossartiae]MBC1543152.1 hypothetical protein [Listeria cossartiae subsp. cossartiae]
MEKRTKEKIIITEHLRESADAFLVAQKRQQLWVSETIDWFFKLFYT